jgi:hypothetical protein
MPSAARLRLRSSPPDGRGALDGGWWPRSRDPASVLRVLIADLNANFGQVGTIARVALNLTAWERTPSRVAIGDRIVPVRWFRALDPHTIILATVGGERVTLLVVPPEATSEQAAIALATAALGDDGAPPAAILQASGITQAGRITADDPAAASRARHPSVSSVPPPAPPAAEAAVPPVP